MKKYTIEIWTISEILDKWKKQKLVQPHCLLTRPFSWDVACCCRVYNALYKGVSIGTLIVWLETPTQYQLLDGRRRLKSLGLAFDVTFNMDEPPFMIDFNPLTQQFQKRTKRHDKTWIPVPEIIKSPTSTLRQFKKDNPAITTKSVNDMINQFKNMKNFEVPIIVYSNEVAYDSIRNDVKYYFY
jgi:hypothetical protein